MRTRDVPHSGRRLLVLAGLAALTLSACRGCGKGEGERPVRYVAKDAEAVLEIRDLGVIAEKRAGVLAAIGSIVTSEQVTALEQEAALTLGFNPTTEKGLEEAGLPKHGSIAVQIANGGASALWIVPVADQVKLDKTIDKIARARANIEASEKVKVGEKELTVLSTTFGPDKLVVAAYAFDHGLAFIGAGRSGKELVAAALALDPAKPDANVLANAEYVALDKALGTSWEARLVVPSAGAAMPRALQVLGRLGGPDAAQVLAAMPEAKGVKSIGWTASFEKRALEVKGRVRFDDATLAKSKAIFAGTTPPPAGVKAAALDDAIVVAYASANAQAFLKELAPAGSKAREELDRAFNRVKEDIDADLEKDLVPALSGHGTVALGLRNLQGVDLRRLVEDPRVLWVSIGLGASEPDKIRAIEEKMDPGIEKKGLFVKKRTLDGKEIHVVARAATDDPNDVLVESVSVGGARVMCTERSLLDKAIAAAAAPKADLLGGKPGAMVEVRFDVLTKQLTQLDLGVLPVLYRAIATKALQVLRLLDRANLEVGPAEDGVELRARISLTEAAGAAPAAK